MCCNIHLLVGDNRNLVSCAVNVRHGKCVNLCDNRHLVLKFNWISVHHCYSNAMRLWMQ